MRETKHPAMQFVVHLDARRGVTTEEARAFERELAAYAASQGLVLDAGHGVIVVRSNARDLTANDQVQFLDWLIDRRAVDTIRIGPLTARHGSTTESSAELLALHALDLPVIGVTLLHRSGYLCPELYLEILRGAARRVTLH